jgi:hypothetical protein
MMRVARTGCPTVIGWELSWAAEAI